jgi:hypothetical protein
VRRCALLAATYFTSMSPQTSRVARASNTLQILNCHPWSDGRISRPRPKNSICLISFYCSVHPNWHRVPLCSEHPRVAVHCEFSHEALLRCVALCSSATVTALLSKSEFFFVKLDCRVRITHWCLPMYSARRHRRTSKVWPLADDAFKAFLMHF